MIYYQVEYKDTDGDVWLSIGQRYSDYADALERLMLEFEAHPSLSHRLVQHRRVHTVLSEITANAEVLV